MGNGQWDLGKSAKWDHTVVSLQYMYQQGVMFRVKVHKPKHIRDNVRKGAVKVRGTPKIRFGRCAAVKLTFSYVSLKFSSAAARPYKGVLDPTF